MRENIERREISAHIGKKNGNVFFFARVISMEKGQGDE